MSSNQITSTNELAFGAWNITRPSVLFHTVSKLVEISTAAIIWPLGEKSISQSMPVGWGCQICGLQPDSHTGRFGWFQFCCWFVAEADSNGSSSKEIGVDDQAQGRSMERTQNTRARMILRDLTSNMSLPTVCLITKKNHCAASSVFLRGSQKRFLERFSVGMVILPTASLTSCAI